MRKRLIETECCTDKRCFICAGLNRRLVFVLTEHSQDSWAGSSRGRRKDQTERGVPLTEKSLQLLNELLRVPGARVKIVEICGLSKKTIDNAARGSKMFSKTRTVIEEAIERLEIYVRECEPVYEGRSERPAEAKELEP